LWKEKVKGLPGADSLIVVPASTRPAIKYYLFFQKFLTSSNKIIAMETATIAQLQVEIARLKQLLEVLIVENAEIKADIAYLKSYNGIPEGDIAHAKSYVGNSEGGIAHLKTYIGNPEGDIAYLKSYVGNSEEDIANVKSYVGNSERDIANVKSYVGNPEGGIAHPKSYMGNSEPLAALPEMITEQSGIKQKLIQYLISLKVAKSNRQAIAVSAALIIHIYNKMPCDYQSLRKITALSQFGLAKRIRAMKKDGFIFSSGYQSFSLTNSTLQLLQQVAAK